MENGKWPRAAAAYKRLLPIAHGPFIIFSQNPNREELLQEIPVAPAALNAVPEPADLDGDFHTVPSVHLLVIARWRPPLMMGVEPEEVRLVFRGNVVGPILPILSENAVGEEVGKEIAVLPAAPDVVPELADAKYLLVAGCEKAFSLHGPRTP